MFHSQFQASNNVLMNSHRFTLTDLENNKKVKLSLAQRKRLQKKIFIQLLIIILCLLFITYGWMASIRSTNIVGEIVMLFLTLGVVFPIKLVVFLLKDLKENRVEKKTGFIRRVQRSEFKGPPSVLYFCQNVEINGVPPESKIDSDKMYTIYFTKYSKHFLSLELA